MGRELPISRSTAEGVDRVAVAIATYNGETFLPELIRSIEAQDWPDVELVASDDGSSDGTERILRATSRPVTFVRNPDRPGVVRNFNNALSHADAPYVALADQDDVWAPTKLSAMLAAARDAEAGDPARPVLVFSDLKVVDEKLGVIRESFFDATSKDRDAATLLDYAISNHVPGCAMLANRALLDRALPIPPGVKMHDWWLALVAASFGRIVHVPQPLVLYRQHGGNTMGAPVAPPPGSRLRTIAGKLGGLPRRIAGYRAAAAEARVTLSLFRDRMGDDLPPRLRRDLDRILSGSRIKRFWTLRRARIGEGLVASTMNVFHL